MHNYHAPISDFEMIDLYKKGWSQKSISQRFKVSVPYLRNTLKDAGFLTGSYRAISDTTKDILIAFIMSGVSVQQISNYTDISFYAIREVIEKNNLQGCSQKIRLENKDKKEAEVHIDEDVLKQVISLFIKGEMGLIRIAERFSLSSSELVEYASYLTPYLKEHKRNIKAYILKQNALDLPISTISKQMNISRGIVKQVISDELE